jgi:hypothetical protein
MKDWQLGDLVRLSMSDVWPGDASGCWHTALVESVSRGMVFVRNERGSPTAVPVEHVVQRRWSLRNPVPNRSLTRYRGRAGQNVFTTNEPWPPQPRPN